MGLLVITAAYRIIPYRMAVVSREAYCKEKANNRYDTDTDTKITASPPCRVVVAM